MEQHAFIWLSISLFSSKENWHRILSEAIAPFAETNRLLKAFKVEFNHLSGENIRLSLLTNIGNEALLAATAHSYFNSYFEEAKLPQQPLKLPVEGVFMPFPANTIQYGLYPPLTVGGDEVDQYALPVTLSKIMVAALQEEIDDETILTFAFYLQIALVKTINKIAQNANVILTLIQPAQNFKPDESALSNLSTMKEITDDIMQTEKFNDELAWVNWWMEDCYAALAAQYNSDNDTSVIKHIYQQRMQTIYRNTCININGRDMLNYLAEQSLEQFFLVSK